ncbi:MAG: tetratricopeptide repeat protein [Candidatus Dormiibacterota bacterium]
MADHLRPQWDFDDLDASERRFDEQLTKEASEAGRAEVLTQLARVKGLRGEFAAGDELIDQAEQLSDGGAAVRARIQLERGRLRNSGGDPAAALALFEAAFETAEQGGESLLAADAAHMAAIASPDRKDKIEWTGRGVRIATESSDRDVSYWLGPLYNNLGWEYQDAGEHEAALEAFKRALASRERYPEMPALIQHAKEAVGEALRALGREDEASRL